LQPFGFAVFPDSSRLDPDGRQKRVDVFLAESDSASNTNSGDLTPYDHPADSDISYRQQVRQLGDSQQLHHFSLPIVLRSIRRDPAF